MSVNVMLAPSDDAKEARALATIAAAAAAPMPIAAQAAVLLFEASALLSASFFRFGPSPFFDFFDWRGPPVVLEAAPLEGFDGVDFFGGLFLLGAIL